MVFEASETKVVTFCILIKVTEKHCYF